MQRGQERRQKSVPNVTTKRDRMGQRHKWHSVVVRRGHGPRSRQRLATRAHVHKDMAEQFQAPHTGERVTCGQSRQLLPTPDP